MHTTTDPWHTPYTEGNHAKLVVYLYSNWPWGFQGERIAWYEPPAHSGDVSPSCLFAANTRSPASLAVPSVPPCSVPSPRVAVSLVSLVSPPISKLWCADTQGTLTTSRWWHCRAPLYHHSVTLALRRVSRLFIYALERVVNILLGFVRDFVLK